jgi:hypothetical protein
MTLEDDPYKLGEKYSLAASGFKVPPALYHRVGLGEALQRFQSGARE